MNISPKTFITEKSCLECPVWNQCKLLLRVLVPKGKTYLPITYVTLFKNSCLLIDNFVTNYYIFVTTISTLPTNLAFIYARINTSHDANIDRSSLMKSYKDTNFAQF